MSKNTNNTNKIFFKIKKLIPTAIKNKIKFLIYFFLNKLSQIAFLKETRKKKYIKWYQEYIDKKADNILISEANKLSGKIDLFFLKKMGLKPKHSLFEFGIGYLRASSHIIKYLNNRKFTGADTSENRIKLGTQTFLTYTKKNPKLIVSSSNSLNWLENKKFDYIYSHAVFCHMPVEDVKEVLINIRKKVMKKKSVLLTTFSVLNFNKFRGCENLEKVKLENKLYKYFDNKDMLILYKKLYSQQKNDVCKAGISNWFLSTPFLIDLVSEVGYKYEDVSNRLNDRKNLVYPIWNRMIKLTIG